MRRLTWQGNPRHHRRLVLLALLAPVGAFTVASILSARPDAGGGAGRQGQQGQQGRQDGGNGVLAYLVATGIFAQPPPEGQSPEFAAAEATAARAGTPVAFTIWTGQEAFDTRVWRDLIQVGRVPAYLPPAIDFMREVAILIWPAAARAPQTLRRAPGLVLRGAALQHTAVEVHIAANTSGQVPATPTTGGDVLPYALVTVPRNQWPISAPPGTVPPLTVSLVT